MTQTEMPRSPSLINKKQVKARVLEIAASQTVNGQPTNFTRVSSSVYEAAEAGLETVLQSIVSDQVETGPTLR